jgi:competence protein ComEC
MRILSLAFLLGVSSLCCWPVLPGVLLLCFVALVCVVCCWFFSNPMIRFISVMGLGFVWVMFYLHLFSAPVLPKALEGKTIILQGRVVSMITTGEQSIHFIVKTSTVNGVKTQWKIRLGWYRHYARVHPGDVWRFSVRLKRPHGHANPGGFDYEEWLFQQHLTASGYVSGAQNKCLSHSRWYNGLDSFRARLSKKIAQVVGPKKVLGFIQALSVGDRSLVTKAQKNVLKATGTSHLLAISGLHIGLVAGLFFFFGTFFWRQFPRLLLRLPAQCAGAFFAMSGALVYAGMAGFGLSTQRALLMIAVVMFCTWQKRLLRPWSALSVALWVILLWDPLAVISASFWLSFSAVVVITFAVSGRLRADGKIKSLYRVQFAVVVGLMPLSLLYFSQVSLVAPLANLVAIPWVGFLVVPFCLLGCAALGVNVTLAKWVFYVAVKNMQWALCFLTWVSHFSWGVWAVSMPSSVALFFSVLGVFLLLMPKGVPAKYLAGLFFLPLFFPVHARIKKNEFRFILLDVGQGLASVIETKHHVMLYDTGPRYSAGYDAGNSVILPFLKTQGIHKLDTIVLSHLDDDHSGGLRSVASAIPVNRIYTSNTRGLHLAHLVLCHAGQHWIWDGVAFEMLYPYQKTLGSSNDRSCVLKISTGKHALLLTGDIEKKSEDLLVKQTTKSLSATVLVAPHHGSKTSSSWGFLDAVSPKMGLFPVGYLNRFHFPSKIIVQRYHALGIQTYQTQKTGAETVVFKPNQPLVFSFYREKRRRIWSMPVAS